VIDETRVERALSQGPPFRTRYVQRPLPLGSETEPHGTRLLAIVTFTVLLVGAISGAALVGSGLIEMPIVPAPSIPAVLPDTSPSPSATADQNATPTWTITGTNLEARSGHTAILLLDGTVLVVGGFAGSSDTSLASAEVYDPVTGAWAATGGMAQARAGHSATLLPDGRVLVAGGAPADFSARTLASAELYDPITGTWTATGGMTEPHLGHAATLLPDGRVLVVGGLEPTGSQIVSGRYSRLASAELYDPATGTWTATRDMAQARHGHTATLLPNGLVLVAGGYDGDRRASAELYDPATGRWTATGDMTEPYGSHTATLLPNGTVLVAGGDAPSGPGAIGWPHAAIYDPTTETWTAMGDMIAAPLGHAATLLPDGRVLVSGGRVHGGPESAKFNDAEVYDPVTGRWTVTASMAEAREGHTATLLPDGSVLVSGGTDQLSAAELFDPVGGT